MARKARGSADAAPISTPPDVADAVSPAIKYPTEQSGDDLRVADRGVDLFARGALQEIAAPRLEDEIAPEGDAQGPRRRRRKTLVADPSAPTAVPLPPPARSPPAPKRPSSRAPRARSTPEIEVVSPSEAPRPARSTHGRSPLTLDETLLDPDVVRVVKRLARAGYEAYLVGGCVRDLLLGRKPKDFDVATDARPEDVRALFRNSRIIGRRFRLVHVLFAGQKVIEVATFRKNPKEGEDVDGGDLLIRSDNVFGTVEEDAVRRDFTINALFYDVERREVLDLFNGLADIERRAVRLIGDPVTRFREDPVRILRAVKFAGKLDLGIDPDVVDAILATREDLALAARPRLFEELLRLLRAGHARRSMFLAWELGLLHVLLPEIATMLDDIDGDEGASVRVFRLLRELDRRTRERDTPFDDIVLWTALLLEPLLEATYGMPDRIGAALEFCEPILQRLAVHRRVADAMRRIVAVLPRLTSGKLGKFVRSELFDQAVAVAEISMAARGDDAGVERLRRAIASAPPAPREPPAAPQPQHEREGHGPPNNGSPRPRMRRPPRLPSVDARSIRCLRRLRVPRRLRVHQHEHPDAAARVVRRARRWRGRERIERPRRRDRERWTIDRGPRRRRDEHRRSRERISRKIERIGGQGERHRGRVADERRVARHGHRGRAS